MQQPTRAPCWISNIAAGMSAGASTRKCFGSWAGGAKASASAKSHQCGNAFVIQKRKPQPYHNDSTLLCFLWLHSSPGHSGDRQGCINIIRIADSGGALPDTAPRLRNLIEVKGDTDSDTAFFQVCWISFLLSL